MSHWSSFPRSEEQQRFEAVLPPSEGWRNMKKSNGRSVRDDKQHASCFLNGQYWTLVSRERGVRLPLQRENCYLSVPPLFSPRPSLNEVPALVFLEHVI